MNKVKYITIIDSIIIVFSFAISIISNDNFLGFLVLCSGLLNIWLQSCGKASNYIFGCIYNICNGYISYINNMYGIFILSILLYFPLNIYGFISWNKINDSNNIIKFRKYEKSKSILIIITALVTSFLLGFFLSIIPSQRLEFLDSSSNVLNIFGMILLNKRLNEGWYILLSNNIVDLIIWTILFINKSPNSVMMFIVSIGYLIINIYSIYKWRDSSTIK